MITVTSTKIFLDMDGVIADFLGSVSRCHNRPLPYDRPEALGVWDTEKLWGISAREFWEPCEGPTFWHDLAKTPEADGLVELLEARFGPENIAILTAPSQSPYCIPGKQAWIARYFPQFCKQMIFTSAKGFLAGPSRILIDDRDRNIDEFTESGGLAITVPRLWNHLHGSATAPLAYVTQKLKELL